MNKLRVLSVLVVLALTLVAAGCGGGGGARSVAIDKDVVGITSTLNNFMAAARSGDQATLQSFLASPGESYLIVKDFGADINNPDDNQSYEFYVNPDLISQVSTDKAYVYTYYIQHSGDPLWLYFDMVREDGRWVIEEMLNKAPEAGGYVEPITPTPISPVAPTEFVASSFNPIRDDIIRIFSVEESSTGRSLPERLVTYYGPGSLESDTGITFHELYEDYSVPGDPDYEGFVPSGASSRNLAGRIAGSIIGRALKDRSTRLFSLRAQVSVPEPVVSAYYGFDSQGAFYLKLYESSGSSMIEFNNGLPLKLFEPSHPFGTKRVVNYSYTIDGTRYGSTITLDIGFLKTLVTPLNTYTAVPITIVDVDDDTTDGEKWTEYLAVGIGEVGFDNFETIDSTSPLDEERLLTRFNSDGSLNERNDPVITNTNTFLGQFNVGDPISPVQVTVTGGSGPYLFRWYVGGFGPESLMGVSLSPEGVLQGVAEGSGAGEEFEGKVEVIDRYNRHSTKTFSYESLVSGAGAVLASIDFAEGGDPSTLYDLYAGVNVNSDPADQTFVLRNDGEGPTLIFQTPPSGPFLPTEEVEVFPDVLVGTWQWNSNWSPAYPVGSSGNSYIIRVGDIAEFYMQNSTLTKYIYIKVQVVDVSALPPGDRRTGDLRLEVIDYDASSSDYFAVSIRK